MMQDFERTQELVDISTNSYGATLAQSADYMRGMEAALNNLTVSFETLITNLINADSIINIVNLITQLIDVVAWMVDQPIILIPLLTIIGLSLLGILTTKTQERNIQKQITASQAEQLEIDRKKSIEALKEQKIVKQQAVLDKKKLLDEKKELLINQQQNKEKLFQKKLDEGFSATEAERVANQYYGKKIAETTAEITKTEAEYKQAQIDLQQTEIALNQKEIESRNYQLSQLGLMGGLIQGILSPLQIISTVMQTINSLQTVWNTLTTIGIALKEKKYKASLKAAGSAEVEAAAEGQVATAAAAANAAKYLPIVGIIIAVALLGLGIALAISKQATVVDDTSAELEDLQVKIYEIGQSYKEVQQLGDEFEELSGKIVQSEEDAKRLDEIIQQLNDNGANITTSADRITQLNQIKQYEAQLERELEEERQKVQSTFVEKYDDFGYFSLEGDTEEETKALKKEWKNATSSERKQIKYNNYLKQMTSTESGRASIRTMTLSNVEGLEDIENEQLQNAIYNAAIENFDQIMDIDGNIDFTNFSNTIMKNIEVLDKALADGSISAISSAYETLDDEAKEMLKSADPMFKVFDTIKAKGNDVASTLTNWGYSLEDLNMLQKKLGTDGIDNFLDTIVEIDKNNPNLSTLQKQGIAFEKLVQMNEDAHEKRKQAYKDYQNGIASEDNEYAKLVEAEKKALAKKEEAQKEYDHSKDKYGNASDEATDILNKASTAYNDVQTAVEAFKTSAELPVDISSIIEMADGLMDVNDRLEMTDQITALSSAVETLGKSFDLANLSIKEQLELLEEYPQIAKFFDKEVLTAAEKRELLQDEFNNALQEAGNMMYKAELLIPAITTNKGVNSLTLGGQFIDFATLFDDTEEASNNRSLLANLTAEEQQSLLQQYADALNLDLTKEEDLKQAESGLNSIIGAAGDYNTGKITKQKLNENGIAGLLSSDLKNRIEENTSAYNQSLTAIERYNNQLSRLDENSEAYTRTLNNRNQALIKNNQDAEESLQELDKTYAEFMNFQITDTTKFSDYAKIVDGVISYDAAALEQLKQNDKDGYESFMLQFEEFEEYGELRNEITDQILKNNEELAQSYVDMAKKEQEAVIESLEKQKEAYEEYFDELDALEEDKETEQSRDSIIKQIQALSGGSDSASKQKIKELQAELNNLDKERLQAQREEQREALLGDMDNRIETANESLDNLDNNLSRILMLMEGTASDEEYKNYYDWAINTFGQETVEAMGIKKYAKGGLVNYTGPAWVDGTKTNPEAFLNAQDTRNIQNLLNQLESNRSNIVNPNIQSQVQSENIVIENITIQTNELNNNQDWRNAGQSLAEEFAAEQRKRGINQNANTRYRR